MLEIRFDDLEAVNIASYIPVDDKKRDAFDDRN
jgi:hypothetical protein